MESEEGAMKKTGGNYSQRNQSVQFLDKRKDGGTGSGKFGWGKRWIA